MANNPPKADLEKDSLVAGLRTKADKIRVLARAGYPRAKIARYLGISYQHVRNVLVDDQRLGRGNRFDPAMAEIEANGRVTIPPAFLRSLGLRDNDRIVVTLEGDSIQLMSLRASVKRAQALVRRFVPEGVNLVDELLRERRNEAEDEGRGG